MQERASSSTFRYVQKGFKFRYVQRECHKKIEFMKFYSYNLICPFVFLMWEFSNGTSIFFDFCTSREPPHFIYCYRKFVIGSFHRRWLSVDPKDVNAILIGC